jgi:septin family protein
MKIHLYISHTKTFTVKQIINLHKIQIKMNRCVIKLYYAAAAAERVARTTAISRQTMDIEERGVRLRLSVVDTPGFGDALDCDDSWRAVCSYVDQQFSQFFQVS